MGSQYVTDSSSDFQLDRQYRRKLERYAEERYKALKKRNRSRAERYLSEIVDDKAIASGTGREVYPLPEDAYVNGEYDSYVLKLPTPEKHKHYGYQRDGRTQNRKEINLWLKDPNPWLVPVVAGDRVGNWLVMPEGMSVTVFPEPQAEWLKSYFLQEATLKQLESEIPDIDLIDENLVVLDNRPKLCDYGVVDG